MGSGADRPASLIKDQPVLDKLGYRQARLIGEGAEASVYEVSGHAVLRLLKSGAALQPLQNQVALLREIHAGLHSLAFETPQVFSIVSIDGRHGTLEKRLPGKTLATVLNTASGSRSTLLRNWLDTAMAVSQIRIRRAGYGDLYKPDDCHHLSFHDYWIARLSESLASRSKEFEHVNVPEIVHALPEPDTPALVHLDLFADNILCDGEAVTAVLDFGYCSIMGDGRLSALCAAVYAGTGFMAAHNSDQQVIDQWLEQHELLIYSDTVKRMLACYWAFANDDKELDAWCRHILC